MRSSPTVRARSWAVWPLVFFFWMLALHLQKEQRCIEGREHWTWRPGSSLTRSPVWEPPGPTFPSLSPRGHNNSSSQGWLYPKSFWGTLISNVQLLILVIDSHCIKVLQPSVFKGGDLMPGILGGMVASIHRVNCSGPSEISRGICGPQKSPTETREHTVVKHWHTPFLPGRAELLHEELYFEACLRKKKKLILGKSLVSIIKHMTKGGLVFT